MLKFGITLLNLMISFAKLFPRLTLHRERRASRVVAAVFGLAAVAAAVPGASFAQGLSATEAAGRTSSQIRVPQVPFDATADRVPTSASQAAAARIEDDKPVAYDDQLDLHPADDDFAGRRALLDRQRAWIDYRFEEAKYECASKFFVNYCIDNARDEQREALRALRSQRLVLEDQERKARAEERDARLAEKRAQTQAEAPQRAAERAKNVSRNRRGRLDSSRQLVEIQIAQLDTAEERARVAVDRAAVRFERGREPAQLVEGADADAAVLARGGTPDDERLARAAVPDVEVAVELGRLRLRQPRA